MILIDYSALIIASIMIDLKRHYGSYAPDTTMVADIKRVRGPFLMSIVGLNSRFRDTYGDMVFAVDCEGDNWRKRRFPFYKGRRKLSKKNSKFDWESIDKVARQLLKEIKLHFPYKIVECRRAEADDIIAVLSKRHAKRKERVLIVSKDKDFVPLQRHSKRIKQWANVDKKFIKSDDPATFLFELVARGDSGDDVPNIRSDLNCFRDNIKMSPVTKGMIEGWLSGSREMTEQEKARFAENDKLINLDRIPKKIRLKIIETHDQKIFVDRSKVFEYLNKHRLHKLYPLHKML